MVKNVSEIRASYRDIFDIFFNIFLLSNLDLTPNCDNTRDLQPSLRGNVNLEVTFKEATQTTNRGRAEQGNDILTIENYSQELISGELSQRLFSITQKLHKKLPEEV